MSAESLKEALVSSTCMERYWDKLSPYWVETFGLVCTDILALIAQERKEAYREGEKAVFNTGRWSGDATRPACCYCVPVIASGIPSDGFDMVAPALAELREKVIRRSCARRLASIHVQYWKDKAW